MEVVLPVALPRTREPLDDQLMRAATGVAFGLAAGLVLDAGDEVALLALIAMGAIVTAVAWRVAGRRWRDVARIALFALSARAAAATMMYVWSAANGLGGTITGDDRGYSSLAWAYAQWLHGVPDPARFPPDWGGNSSLFGTFTYLAAAVYYLAGYRPLLVELLNATIATVGAIFIWDTARELFGSRVARIVLILLAILPSHVVFSSLLLKDAVSFTIIAVAVWAVVRFQRSPALHLIIVSVTCVLLMYSLRTYTAFALAVAAFVGVTVSRHISTAARAAWAATAALACGGALIIAISGGSGAIPALSFAQLEGVRNAMGAGAHTAFTVPAAPDRPVLPTAQVASVAAPAASPPAELRLSDTPLPAIGRALIGLAILIPLAWLFSRSSTRGPVALLALALTMALFGSILAAHLPALVAATRSDQHAAERTLYYLPTGLAYVLGAPFPWSVRRPLDLPTVPEAIVSYIVIAAALFTVRRAGAAWRGVVTLGVFTFVMGAVFVLAEGNVGTLLRHRTMSIMPFLIVLGVPSLLALADRLRRRVRAPGAPIATGSARLS